jgi:hypothetical protein
MTVFKLPKSQPTTDIFFLGGLFYAVSEGFARKRGEKV